MAMLTDEQVLVRDLLDGAEPLMTATTEAQIATAIKDSMIAADFAQKQGLLDIHQAMVTRARRLLGLPQ